jgi:hypothetical protein
MNCTGFPPLSIVEIEDGCAGAGRKPPDGSVNAKVPTSNRTTIIIASMIFIEGSPSLELVYTKKDDE